MKEIKEKKMKEEERSYYHGTPYPEEIKVQGFEAISDEVNWYPGISFAKKKSYAEDYTGDGGEVLEVKLRVENPIEYGDKRVVPTKWENEKFGDIGSFYAAADRLGFDAVTGPGEVRVFKGTQILVIGEKK